ncbi:MAG: hypothetical protein JXA44_02575 [Methanospirillaceae archaeon]|nr:hypothetical protein [Methanospirillaceae archaeon]
MKLKLLFVLLVCMTLFTAVVTGDEEAAVIAIEEDAGISEEATGNDEVITVVLLTDEGEAALSALEHAILLATEEAFDYLLTGNTDEKKVFFDEIDSIPALITAFEEKADLTRPEAAEARVFFDTVIEGTAGMKTAADTMFASYDEENKTAVPEDVFAFEEQVDNTTSHIAFLWDVQSASRTEPITLDSYRLWLMSVLLEASEETYAYPVLGDATEKDDAIAMFLTFDTVVQEAQEVYPDASFDDLITIKENLQAAAETLFATYEIEGTVNQDEFIAFETALEAFNDDFIKVIMSDEEETGTEEIVAATVIVAETTG